MTFPIPSAFSYPWNDVLTKHLAQLMNPITGGINTWDIRPSTGIDGQTLGPNHIGYTGFNTNQKVIERWNGSSWDTLSGNAAGAAAMPTWMSSTRPTARSTGDFGYNSTTKQIERWNGTSWQGVSSTDLDIWPTSSRPNLSGEPAGKIGYNTTTKQIERWNGTGWENVTASLTPPLSTWSTTNRPGLTSADEGRFGFNTTTKQIERWNGTSWDNITPPLDISVGMPVWSTRPPVTPNDAGKFGFNLSTRKLERWDGSQWQDIAPRNDTPFGIGAWPTSGRPSLTGSDLGVSGYNTDTKKIERWDGSQWRDITFRSDGATILESWSTSSRPLLGANDAGRIGYNTTNGRLEKWNGSNWENITPALGGSDAVIPTFTSTTKPNLTSNDIGRLGYNSTTPGFERWDGSSWQPLAASTPSGAPVSATAPSPPTIGQLWYDTATTPNQLKVWNGSAWVPATSAPTNSVTTTPPPSPTVGQFWLDTSTTPNQLKVWNGSAWVPATTPSQQAPGTAVSYAAPTNPPVGQLWYDTSVTPNQLKVWNGNAWVPATTPTSSGQPAGTTVSSTQPSSPTTGQLWYDSGSSPNQLKVWNGSAWVPATSPAPPAAVSPTAPTGPSQGQLWYDSGTNQLKMWNGSAWVPVAAGIPVSASRPISPTPGMTYFNSSTGALEYWDGTQWITLTPTGAGTGPGASWSTAIPVQSSITGSPANYYLLDPVNGTFEFKLPANPAIGTKVSLRGLTSATNTSIYINPNGKRFMGTTDRRIYTGTLPVDITFISELDGWMSSVYLPMEIIQTPVPNLSTAVLRFVATERVETVGGKVKKWTSDIGGHLIEAEAYDRFYYGDAYIILEFLALAQNSKPGIVFPYNDQGNYTELRDASAYKPLANCTVYLVAKETSSNASKRDACILSIGREGDGQIASGYKFGTFGLQEYGPWNTSAGAAFVPQTLVTANIPVNKRPPHNTFSIYVYQIESDGSSKMLKVLNSLGEVLCLVPSSYSNDIPSGRYNNQSDSLILGGGRSTFINSQDVNNFNSPFVLCEARMYPSAQSSGQVKAIVEELRQTYAITNLIV